MEPKMERMKKKKLYYSSQGWQDELLNTIYPFASPEQLAAPSYPALTIELCISALVPFKPLHPQGGTLFDLNLFSNWKGFLCISLCVHLCVRCVPRAKKSS